MDKPPCFKKENENGPAQSDSLSPERFEAVLRSISDGVFTVDLDGRISCFNRAAEEITGFSRDAAIGQTCKDIFRSQLCKDACALRYTMETNTPVVDLMVHITSAKGEEIPVSVSTSLFRDKTGTVVGGVETFRDLRQVEDLRKRIKESYSFQDIISKSKAMHQVLDMLPTIAQSNSVVLITGETGTGKELVARAIHNLSGRSKGPFIPINSAGIPDTLMEAELFGYEAGAFTGAVKAKPGRFARAEKGTLFLDEIGELPMQLQAKLLRVLQEKTYEPLGSIRPVTANVRIIVATNRDLEEMVSTDAFRKDLYYRINVFEIKLPPLRDRMDDVPILVDHFVRRMSVEKDKRIAGVSPEALRVLMSHDYPGNVRELENAVEHGFVLSLGPLIGIEHLPAWLNPQALIPPEGAGFEELERHYILAALKSNNYNRLATARQLGIHKTTFFRKVHKLGIELPDQDGRSARNK
jgi:PAS domain S-box-containing protein